MPDTGLIYATTCSNDSTVGTKDWSNPTLAQGNDTNQASCSGGGFGALITHYLVGEFTTGLDSSHAIVGIEVAFNRYYTRDTGSATCNDSSIKLFKNSTLGSSEKSSGTTWTINTAAWSGNYGGSTDLWGHGSISGADTIKIAVSASLGSKYISGRILAFRATVYYTDAPSGEVKKRVIFF